jgi:MFS superfamily sulfate permease-like transporter
MTNFFVAAFAFIAFIDFDFIAFFADHASFLASRFQSLQNRTIVNVQREHDQIKKEIQILQFDSSSFFDKEKFEESIKKNDRMIRTMIYFYLRHVRKIVDKDVKIFKKQLKFSKFNMFY